MEYKLTTKEFAAMCKVEKRTLYYYEEIDLLKPIEIKENGYRMYTSSQFETMSMIKALQSVGMSLLDVKKMMENKNLNLSIEIFSKQADLLRAKQEELKKAEEILIHSKEQIEAYLKIGCEKLFIEKLPATYLTVEKLEVKEAFFVNYITSGYNFGVIIAGKEALYPKYTFKRADNIDDSNLTKPAGTYASIYKSIPNGKITEKLYEFIGLLGKEQITKEGYVYLESIANDFISFPRNEYLFKISGKINLAAVSINY